MQKPSSSPSLTRASRYSRVTDAFRGARQVVSLACLLAIGGAVGCAPEKEKESPADEVAPWILRDPQLKAPVDQICSPSTIPLEVADSGSEPPSRHAMRRELLPEKLERNLYDRIRTTGEYETVLRDDGGVWVNFVPTEGVYGDLLAMFPGIQVEAENRHIPNSDLELTGPVIAEWQGAESERVRLNREIESFRLLQKCLGFEINEEMLAQVAVRQEPYPASWTDNFLVDPTDPDIFTGQEFIEGESMRINAPGESLRYVSFDKVRGDHLSAFLGQVIDPKYFDSIPQLSAFIRLTSPEGEWRVPVEYLNQNEQFGVWVRSLELSDPPDDSLRLKYYRKIRGALGSKMLLKAQYDYHRKNGYPPFTEENRESNIAALTGAHGEGPLKKVEPTADDHFVLRWIYESDPENTDKAAYAYQETLDLIKEMGRAVNNGLHNFGLPEYIEAKILVTSLGRTVEYIEALRSGVTLADYLDPRPDNPFRKGNRNAARTSVDEDGNILELSGHGYFNAADVSSVRLLLIDTRTGAEYVVGIKENGPLINAARVSMYAFLATRGERGQAMGAPEKDHVHMSGVRIEESSGERK